MQNEADEIANRLRKTLRFHYDRPSLRVTNLAVEYFAQNVEPSLDQVDMNFATDLTRKTHLTPCSLMLALVYVDRLRNCNPEYLHKISSSDLFLVSLMVASKFLNDEGERDEVYNDYWAESARMEKQDLNKLEREFLAALDWHAFVDTQTLLRFVERTEFILAFRQGNENRWFSYTDLDILSKNIRLPYQMSFIFDNVIKVIVVCAVAYTVSVLTLVASTYIVSRIMGPTITLHTNDLTRSTSVSVNDLHESRNLSHELNVSVNCLIPSTIVEPRLLSSISSVERESNGSNNRNDFLVAKIILHHEEKENLSSLDLVRSYKIVETLWAPNFGTAAVAR